MAVSKFVKAWSDEEKNKLREAMTGETICPRGCTIDETKLNPELVQKLNEL